MTQRATLHIREEDNLPDSFRLTGTLVGVRVEIVKRTGQWRASDEFGHEVFDYWKDSAALRCLALRLGFEDPGELKRPPE